MTIHFYNIIFSIEAFLYLLFSVFLITHKKGHIIGNRLFAGFLISKMLVNINFLCSFNGQFSFPAGWAVYIILHTFVFLVGPFLTLYTQSILYRDFRLKKHHAVHAIPFFLYFLYRCIKLFSTPDAKQILIQNGTLLTQTEDSVLSLAIDVHILIYIIAALWILRTYRSEIREFYSSPHQLNMSWLKLVLWGYFTIQAIGFVKHSSIVFYGTTMQILARAAHVGALILASIIIYQSLRRPELFSGINHKGRYEKSQLKESYKKMYLKKLLDYMESDKPYLDSTLTLYDLSGQVKIPPHHLSQILNTCLNKNFFDFINSYRIEESKKLLSNSNHSKKTILQIVYDTGFNSKSVFNTAFKKFTGMTPSQFRSEQNS